MYHWLPYVYVYYGLEMLLWRYEVPGDLVRLLWSRQLFPAL